MRGLKKMNKLNKFVEVLACTEKSVEEKVLKGEPKYYEHIGEVDHLLKDEFKINSTDDGCIHWIDKEKRIFSFVKIPRNEAIVEGQIKK